MTTASHSAARPDLFDIIYSATTAGLIGM